MGTRKTTSAKGVLRSLTGRVSLPRVGMGGFGGAGGPGPVEQRVRRFLAELKDELGIDSSPRGLKLIKKDNSAVGSHLRFGHVVNDVPVYGTEIAVHVDGDKLVRMNVSTFKDRRMGNVVEGEEKIDPETAKEIVSAALGDHREIGARPTRKTYFPTENGLRLAFVVEIATEKADWRYIVDAETGDVLLKRNLRVKVDGAGMVFDPNPVVTANDNSFLEDVTPESKLNDQRVSRTLPDITQSGSQYLLEGPYVRIVDKIAQVADPPASSSATFDYERKEHEFEAVNVYYHIDKLQRYIQDALDIKNVMNRPVEADHHVSEDGGAFYSSFEDFLGFGGSGTEPDSAEDADVIVHEYGHAIQYEMVSDWGRESPLTHREEALAMGEGFGDALACIHFYEAGGIYQPEVFEDWIHPPDGLRRVDGVKKYPGEDTTHTVGDWTNSPHVDGQIWSATLWNAYLAAGGNSSSSKTRAEARADILKTAILHHFKLSGDESMPEAAEAMLETNAEIPGIDGRQLIQLLDSFQDRNILHSDAGVDLWIQDDPLHTGDEDFSGTFWNSPDVWIRNDEDDGETHQAPKSGQDNWFYCRVHNRGSDTARAFAVTFEVKIWNGTQFVYPNDFIPYVAAAPGFNLEPGDSVVVKARWPKSEIPGPDSHGCVLVSAYAPTDEPATGKHVWEDNNLAQKNLKVLSLRPGESGDVSFRIGNPQNGRPGRYRIEVRRPAGREDLPLSLFHPDEAVVRTLYEAIRTTDTDRASRSRFPFWRIRGRAASAPARNAADTDVAGFLDNGAVLDRSEIRFKPGRVVGFPTFLAPRWNPTLKLRLAAPDDAQRGDEYTVDVIQRDNRGQIVGGISVLIRVVASR